MFFCLGRGLQQRPTALGTDQVLQPLKIKNVFFYTSLFSCSLIGHCREVFGPLGSPRGVVLERLK